MMGKGDKKVVSWSKKVRIATDYKWSIIERFRNSPQRHIEQRLQLGRVDFQRDPFTDATIDLAFLLDRKITQLTYEDRCLARVQGIISKVEKGGDYQFLARVLRAANNKELEYDPIPFEIILTDFCLVLARFSKNGELLVGLRNGVPVWKGVKIEESPYEGQFLAFYEGIIPIIDCIGEKELDLIPENPMSGVSALKIAFPMITKTTDRILEDAYFNQRFSIHPDGAMITFEDAGMFER